MPAPGYGQISTTGSAQQVDPSQKGGSCTAFVIRAPLTNTGKVFIGDASVTTGTGHQLDPGDEITYERASQTGQAFFQQRPSDFFVWIVTSGDVVTWLALQ